MPDAKIEVALLIL